MKSFNPLKKGRRENDNQKNSMGNGDYAGTVDTPLPRLTWKGFWMGILVSMGKNTETRI